MFDWLGKYWHDVLDVASTAATVAAAGLAWCAIRRGNRQAQASADALVRERRIDFELGHLDKMGEAVGLGNPGGSETITRSLTLLPADEFPRLRARVGMSSTREADAAFTERQKQGQEQAVIDDYQQTMRDEINQAIERRLAERG